MHSMVMYKIKLTFLKGLGTGFPFVPANSLQCE